jgi:Zn-dependent peptidase ImmA (M78 family)
MRISQNLELPIGYFISERPNGGDLTTTAFFRCFKSRTNSTHKMLRRWSVWAAQFVNYVNSVVNLPPLVIPNPNRSSYTDEEIESLAMECRRMWGLSSGPIVNMVTLLENNGFIVVRTEFSVADTDAFSCWQDGRPFIILGDDKHCAVRSRFDAAHELGHMILHRSISQEEIENPGNLSRVEHEANRFAAAFLLPPKTFLSEVYSCSLKQFVELKKRWKVAIAAMIFRCKDLGVFDDQDYINLRKQISFHKWIKKEPLDDEIEVEFPQLITQCIKLMIKSGIRTTMDFTADLQLPAKVLATLGGFSEKLLLIPDNIPADYPIALNQGIQKSA